MATRHLDIEVGDLAAAAEHAPACGAVLAGVRPQPDVRVLFDPDGHPFCLFTWPPPRACVARRRSASHTGASHTTQQGVRGTS
ncbi:VOC family protein [Nocardia sp. NRRL S-836]|uniref:VOC family protein n=1 Tax=Nocardia sp. NRRL S-836 TaxID=1519492 RepID=UPI001E3D0EBB|nr:VOC family protein [Nocardia sp. NRRL S-836]